MRASELLDRPAGVERADHVCWAYVDDASFEEAALRFLAEGLAVGDRLMWVGDGAADRLRRSTGPLAAVDELTGRGTLELFSVDEGYTTAGFSPEQQLAFYDAATRAAIDEGYRGLRVVAELTPLAADPLDRPELLRWEQLADDFIASGPGFSALCAYRSDELPDEAVADVAAVHPVSHTDSAGTSFRVWFEEGALRVAGDVDRFTSDRLGRLLASTHVLTPVVTLDLSRLDFIDLAGVRAVSRWAEDLRARSRCLDLVGASRLFRRMWEVLRPEGAPGVRFRAAAG